jgi:hypothetical protein
MSSTRLIACGIITLALLLAAMTVYSRSHQFSDDLERKRVIDELTSFGNDVMGIVQGSDPNLTRALHYAVANNFRALSVCGHVNHLLTKRFDLVTEPSPMAGGGWIGGAASPRGSLEFTGSYWRVSGLDFIGHTPKDVTLAATYERDHALGTVVLQFLPHHATLTIVEHVR